MSASLILDKTFCCPDAHSWFLRAWQLLVILMRADEFTYEEQWLAVDTVAVPAMAAGYHLDLKCRDG